MTTPKRRTAARAAGVLATILCLLGMGFGRADAELLTPNRCTNHYVNAPVHNYTMTVCWQYGYRAQGDGTGVYDETLYMDIRNACDHLDDPEVYNMTLTLRNPKTGVVNGVQDLRDALSQLPANSSAEDIQNVVYEIGRREPFLDTVKKGKDGRPGVSLEWFNMLYQVLFGQQKGPRFGSFAAVYGIENTIAMIDGALARSA